jgi:hypothetical protein
MELTTPKTFQRFSTPIKTEFIITTAQTAFNLVKAHQTILKLLQNKVPILEIIPSKAGKASFKNLVQFPVNKTEYNEHFNHAVQKEPTEARKILVCHSLHQSQIFRPQVPKCQTHGAPVQKQDLYPLQPVRILGSRSFRFIQDVHPHITFRDSFSYNLSEAIHLEMTDAKKNQNQ